MRTLVTLSLALLATPALAAGAQTSWGGALDPISASLAIGLGGAVLWRARSRRTQA